MVNAGVSVGSGRPFIKNKTRAFTAFFYTFIKDILFTPEFQYILFLLAKSALLFTG